MASRYMSKSEFAEHLGKVPSYITKLSNSGRLVFTGDGRIKVAESMALIESTKGTRSDVAARHSAARQEEKTEQVEPSASAAEKKQAKTKNIEAQKTLQEASHVKALAESRRVSALADKEEMERDRMAGDLIPREDVDATMKFIGATVRGLMDVFPDQVAPLVAAVSNLDECNALLAEQCRNVLVGLGDAINKQRKTLDVSNSD